MPLQQTTFEMIVAKGENAHDDMINFSICDNDFNSSLILILSLKDFLIFWNFDLPFHDIQQISKPKYERLIYINLMRRRLFENMLTKEEITQNKRAMRPWNSSPENGLFKT